MNECERFGAHGAPFRTLQWPDTVVNQANVISFAGIESRLRWHSRSLFLLNLLDDNTFFKNPFSGKQTERRV